MPCICLYIRCLAFHRLCYCRWPFAYRFTFAQSSAIMLKEIPGFYYDPEKNRYFPCKGPIPGSSSKPPIPPPSHDIQADGLCKRFKLRPELLQSRELCGDLISSGKKKLNFQAEYQKRNVSQPMVWKYRGTKRMANISLEHGVADVMLPVGIVESDILLSGGMIGLLCVFQVGKNRQEFGPTRFYKVDSVWPHNSDQMPRHKELLRHLGGYRGSGQPMSSDVSCVVTSRNRYQRTGDTMAKRYVVTTLGSADTPGCVYILDLSKPLDFSSLSPIDGGFNEISQFNQTIWTADCDPDGTHAAIGTSRGVALLNIETKVSGLYRYKSDVLSVQFGQTGNSILCGLRNGDILTVDTRQKPMRIAGRSRKVSMPSSVCCLTSLMLWDEYFLASSMDGSMKLYDHRLMHRGAVQSYDGNVNSHTRIGLGVDPSEKVVMSGGEDCCVRVWDIKSGEMLFKEQFMGAVPSVVCWPKSMGGEDHGLGAWVGSYEGIFYMDWL